MKAILSSYSLQKDEHFCFEDDFLEGWSIRSNELRKVRALILLTIAVATAHAKSPSGRGPAADFVRSTSDFSVAFLR